MKWRIACPIQLSNYLYIWNKMLTLHQWFLHDFMGFCASYPNVFCGSLYSRDGRGSFFIHGAGQGGARPKSTGRRGARAGSILRFGWLRSFATAKEILIRIVLLISISAGRPSLLYSMHKSRNAKIALFLNQKKMSPGFRQGRHCLVCGFQAKQNHNLWSNGWICLLICLILEINWYLHWERSMVAKSQWILYLPFKVFLPWW